MPSPVDAKERKSVSKPIWFRAKQLDTRSIPFLGACAHAARRQGLVVVRVVDAFTMPSDDHEVSRLRQSHFVLSLPSVQKSHLEKPAMSIKTYWFSAALGLYAAAPVHAQVTYTYTGAPLNSFFNGDPAHLVNSTGLFATFTFASAVASNIGTTDNFSAVVPTSWSITGGGYALNSSQPGAVLNGGPTPAALYVFTDAGGALLGWDFLATSIVNAEQTGPTFRSFLYPTGQFSTSMPTIKTDVAAYWNMPAGVSTGENTSVSGGAWTISAVPEPSSLALWMAGLVLLPWAAARRATALSAR